MTDEGPEVSLNYGVTTRPATDGRRRIRTRQHCFSQRR